jgi:hypothetical protein
MPHPTPADANKSLGKQHIIHNEMTTVIEKRDNLPDSQLFDYPSALIPNSAFLCYCRCAWLLLKKLPEFETLISG